MNRIGTDQCHKNEMRLTVKFAIAKKSTTINNTDNIINDRSSIWITHRMALWQDYQLHPSQFQPYDLRHDRNLRHAILRV